MVFKVVRENIKNNIRQYVVIFQYNIKLGLQEII
jgi:hypothetical protein